MEKEKKKTHNGWKKQQLRTEKNVTFKSTILIVTLN